MKRIIIKTSAVFLFHLFTISIKAQHQTDSLKAKLPTDSLKIASSLNHFALGFNLNQYQHDFGVGANITSPYILHLLAFRLMGSAQWLQCIPKGDTTAIWSPYQNFRLSVVTRQFVITNKISLYSEGGVVMILPNKKFTNQSTQFGGFGVFGFEFHPSVNWAQFIEAGGIGTGAVANKAIGNPIYSNGFIVSTGFRLYF